jgi:hypothetical protein
MVEMIMKHNVGACMVRLKFTFQMTLHCSAPQWIPHFTYSLGTTKKLGRHFLPNMVMPKGFMDGNLMNFVRLLKDTLYLFFNHMEGKES